MRVDVSTTAHDEDPSAETDGECACGWTSIVIEYSR